MKEHQEKVLVTWQDVQLIYLSRKKTLNVLVSSVLSKQLFPEGLLPFERDASTNFNYNLQTKYSKYIH